MNPLAITEEELLALERDTKDFQSFRVTARNPQKTSRIDIVEEATRGAGERVVGTFVEAGRHPRGGADYGRLLVAAAEYLYLLPLAIRMIRESEHKSQASK